MIKILTRKQYNVLTEETAHFLSPFKSSLILYHFKSMKDTKPFHVSQISGNI